MEKIKKGVILVGGMGTRFLPATKAQPKEMLPIVDKPVVQYIVEEMAASGIEQIIFVTSQAKRAIEDHFDKNFELEHRLEKAGKLELLKTVQNISSKVKFAYTRQPEALGNGHALLCAKQLLNNGPFVFSDGDSVIDSKVPLTKQIIDIYSKHQGSVVAVQKVPKERLDKYGIVKVEQIDDKVYKLKGIVEKPKIEEAPSSLAILGMRYILTPEIFDYLEKQKPGKGGEIWFADAMNEFCKVNDTYAYDYDGKYFDTGNKLEYLKAVVEYGLKHEELSEDFQTYLKELSK